MGGDGKVVRWDTEWDSRAGGGDTFRHTHKNRIKVKQRWQKKLAKLWRKLKLKSKSRQEDKHPGCETSNHLSSIGKKRECLHWPRQAKQKVPTCGSILCRSSVGFHGSEIAGPL